jgi:mannitol-1-phosphate/altronate dehydrogenase
MREKFHLMGNNRKGNFVGFGLGPIQTGLFLYEAYCSGNFQSFTIAEVDDSLVESVNKNNGRCTFNIAFPDNILSTNIEGIRMLNLKKSNDRKEIIKAISYADEIATSLPSVSFYETGDPVSVASCLAQGLEKRTSDQMTIIYTAENNNHAAELLRAKVAKYEGERKNINVQYVNTVIGKMSSIVENPMFAKRYGLSSLSPDSDKTILVEAFNKILISKIDLPGFIRRIDIFQEKTDLKPFEEAKLYGHNAIHLLLGLLAAERGCKTLSEARHYADVMNFARIAFIEEAGAGLIHKYHGYDELFTNSGFCSYAEDLLTRMTNPLLGDPISRITRDLHRKIGWDDRLIGSARLAMDAGIQPHNLLKGIQLAQKYILTELLRDIWPSEVWISGKADQFILPLA